MSAKHATVCPLRSAAVSLAENARYTVPFSPMANVRSGLENPVLEPPQDSAQAADQLKVAMGQIQFARAYVLELLEGTPHALWFGIPDGAATSIAWQVGHLAVSQYGLLMFRQRGRLPEDLDLIPGTFRKKYGRGSKPEAETPDDPTVAATALVDRLNLVYETAMRELGVSDPGRLLEPSEMPYAVYPNKLGAVLFCPLHEQLHAGQIGVLRRMLGLESIR